MAKPKSITRTCSQYSLEALSLLGQLIREARLSRALTTSDLAVRSGISRSLLQRIERGDPGCSIGAVFEVAAICGVPLFESDARLLTQQLVRQQKKMALMPKAIRTGRQVVNDDF
jgi:transcriptional regulator with XRE-family HTH domain